jgi:tetratricopeptide (TPR) repeat protein
VPRRTEPVTRLQEARLERGWTQSELIGRLVDEAARSGSPIAKPQSLKVMLSRWENGAPVTDPYPQLFARVYGCSVTDLGIEGQQVESSRPARSPRVAPKLGNDAVSYFWNVFLAHIQADNLMGPHHLVEVVRAQANLLDQLLPSASGRTRQRLVYLAYRYNEFAGWLYQDAGELAPAMAYSDRAMDYALELGTPRENSYVLMRKANIAIDDGRPDRALGLTQAALRHESNLPPRVRALALAQRARAFAAQGGASDSAQTLDRAYHAVSLPSAGSDDLAAYCTPSYIEMEAAACWAKLGNYDAAIPIFERSIRSLPAQQRRDQGVCLARLANAYVGRGDVDSACRAGRQAVEVVGAATSQRALRELQALRVKLLPWRKDAEAWQVGDQIRHLIGS